MFSQMHNLARQTFKASTGVIRISQIYFTQPTIQSKALIYLATFDDLN